MKKKALIVPLTDENTKLYLRKAGDKVNGLFPYMCFDAIGNRTVVVFASSRDMARTVVWKKFGLTAKFWR